VNDAVDGACSAASKCHRLVASKPERLKEVRPGNDDGVPKFWRNWRGHDDVMQTRSIRGSGEPVWVIALLKCARTIGTRSAQSIMASGFTAAQTGRTHDRTRPMLHKRQKVLAKAAPSTHDPNRTLRTFETSTRWARLRLKPGLDSPEQPEAHVVVIARERSSSAINSMAISGPDTKPPREVSLPNDGIGS
jgi:hypothetical protein